MSQIRFQFAATAVPALAAACILASIRSPLSADESVDFERDVRPLLKARCYDCHGKETREAGLRLDRKEAALAGSDSGLVIVKTDAEHSPLMMRLTSEDPAEVMPPDGDPLTADELAVVRRWIDEGAHWPDGIDGPVERPTHWAFQPIVRADLPESSGRTSPIDALVQMRLKENGLSPSPEADRYTLVKRLYYDLLGLPPEPEAVEAFVNDAAPGAYERLVDDLLKSPHFGERWGRHWLDLARYADSDGYEKDRPRYNAWKYRDWVIQAINDDMPFDQFTIEQLAGDLLPGATPEQLLATAFHRQTLTNTEGGTDQEQWRVEAIFDRVETLGTAWLGLTVGCARCHSHKYDELSQREYYQLFAFFNNGDEVTTSMPSSEEALVEYTAQKKTYDAILDELTAPLKAAKERLRPGYADWETAQKARVTDAVENSPKFHPLRITEVVSEAGATIEPLDDGSYLVTGDMPAKDAYLVTLKLDRAITGFKLEVLTHKSLPKSGPGRPANGNFVLTEFSLEERPGAFVAARSDFSQKGFDPAKAIDGADDTGGWAISPEMGKPHEAVFALGEPLAADPATPSTITLRLSQQYKTPHTIGCFRLSGMTGEDPELLGLPDEVRKSLALEEDKRSEKQKDELFDYFASRDPEVKALQATVDAHKKAAPFNPNMTVRVLKERTKDRRQTHVMKRGDFLQPLGEVSPATFAILHGLTAQGDDSEPNRLDLARWLVSPENPLTPRVTVNHIWSHLFGRGLVKTVGDFGVRGEAPTNPELLDWLASEFIRLGWSRKQFVKTIVMSHTYRQSSAHRPEQEKTDPENRLLSRQNRFRVEAEIVRDLVLSVSGLLDRRIGGPSVFPPLPPGIAELSYAGNFKWGNSDWNSRPDRPHGVAPKDDVHRRGLYTFFKRTAAHPNLVTFDCPDANTTCVERSTSNTPLQSLQTLNNNVFVTSARALARRVDDEINTNDAERLAYAFRLCTARPPSNEELNALLELLRDARAYYGEHADEAISFAGDELPPETSAAAAAAWIATVRIVMNLDEFLTRE